MTETPWLSSLLQLSDSTLPIGAYAHSFGLEGLVQMGAVRDAGGLERFLRRELLGSLVEVELPLVRLARGHLAAGSLDDLERLDHLALATRLTAEFRSASSRMGRQLLTLGAQLLPERADELARIVARLPHRQAPIATAVLHHLRGIPVDAGLHAVAWQTLTGVAQAGLKLLHLGPSAIQAMLSRCTADLPQAVADSLAYDEHGLGSYTPLWEIASSRHQRAPARLFLS